MKNSYFYSIADIKRMKELIRTGEPLSFIADREHQNFGATRSAFYTKLVNVAKHTTKIQEWNGPKRRKKGFAVTPIVEQVALPEGFTFEGTPKKVTFCVDHFRVYF